MTSTPQPLRFPVAFSQPPFQDCSGLFVPAFFDFPNPTRGGIRLQPNCPLFVLLPFLCTVLVPARVLSAQQAKHLMHRHLVLVQLYVSKIRYVRVDHVFQHSSHYLHFAAHVLCYAALYSGPVNADTANPVFPTPFLNTRHDYEAKALDRLFSRSPRPLLAYYVLHTDLAGYRFQVAETDSPQSSQHQSRYYPMSAMTGT
mmetsp:Transcript_13458/g.24078  ORF Transcript_13458/g.24078 Transcript_13458/m.24078 type:complete len:200 (-) Transcript_13458:395-994(-)